MFFFPFKTHSRYHHLKKVTENPRIFVIGVKDFNSRGFFVFWGVRSSVDFWNLYRLRDCKCNCRKKDEEKMKFCTWLGTEKVAFDKYRKEILRRERVCVLNEVRQNEMLKL